MTRLAALILLVFSATAAHSSDVWAGDVPNGYRLVWADTFDKGTMPDPAKWSYDTGWNKPGWLLHILSPRRSGSFKGSALGHSPLFAASRGTNR